MYMHMYCTYDNIIQNHIHSLLLTHNTNDTVAAVSCSMDFSPFLLLFSPILAFCFFSPSLILLW